jgi:hypothetical protein
MTDDSELNLTTHRAPESVWGRRGWDGTRQPRTIARWMLGISGCALAVHGLRQRSFAGSVMIALGGGLAFWALTGEGDLSDARRWADGLVDRAGLRGTDLVSETSENSFPASDAPAWTPTVGTGLRRRSSPA